MSYEKLLYRVDHDVAEIRLNDPASLNSISSAMGAEMIDAFTRAQKEARAICLTGEGRGFCAGANLNDSALDVTSPDRDAGLTLEKMYNPMITGLRDLSIPLVVGVRGAAAGVGCSIALCGDVIVAGESAYFYQAFRHIGLVPDGGSSYLLARTIGRVRAMEMMLLGEKLPAPKALDWGLITRVVADGEVDSTALNFARELARGPKALGFIRKQAWAALDAGLEDQLALERVMQRDASRTEDFVEGVSAFLGKRKADFKGK